MKVNKYRLKVDAKSKKEAIHDTIASMYGIKAIRVDSFANTVTVDYDDEKVCSSEIESALKQNNFI